MRKFSHDPLGAVMALARRECRTERRGELLERTKVAKPGRHGESVKLLERAILPPQGVKEFKSVAE